MSSSPTLAVVMPAYNEAGCISAVIEKWLQEIPKHLEDSFIVIVVNDGSKDRTGEILEELKRAHQCLRIIHQENQGHGAALRRAYEEALKENPHWVFHVDSDDQFLASDFVHLWKRRAEGDFLLGFRKSRHDPFHRLVITRILRALLFLFFGTYIRDANCPFRLMKGEYLRNMLAVLPQGVFAPNIFLAVLAAKEGQLIAQPVTHRERKTGKISIVKLNLLKACLRSAKEIFAFRSSLNRYLRGVR